MSCDGHNLTVISTTGKNVIDMPALPQAAATCHITETGECSDCHNVAVPETGLLDGTPLGPNLGSVAAAMEPEANSVKIEMSAKTAPVNIDEIPYPVLGDACQGRAAMDTDSRSWRWPPAVERSSRRRIFRTTAGP